MAKAQDYNKLKKDQLEELCKQRSLAAAGKKADLISRLEEFDAAAEAAEAAAPAPAAAAPVEAAVAPAAETKSTEASQPVPASSAPAAEQPSSALSVPAEAPTAPTAGAAAEPTPAKDYSANLASTSLTDELARRKARAARFGLGGADEVDKELARAKRFGADAVSGSGVVTGLDSALPEEGKRKRGREGNEAGRDAKRQDSRTRQKGGAKDGGETAMSDADKLKAEARKKRFAAAG